MILDGHVPSLAVAGLAQTLAEGDLTVWGRPGRNYADVADHRQCPLLGLRCERASGDYAAKRGDKFPPFKANGHLPLPVGGNPIEEE
jgi:hypothetical protein